jgi:hypothetical protein
MMKTSVFALDQRGPSGGEGRERTGMALLTSATCRACCGNALSPAQCRLRLTPGRGRSTGGGLCPKDRSPWRTALLVPWGLCHAVLSRSVRNKELCPWGLQWGRGGGETAQMNSQVGKEGGKRGRGGARWWFADSKICCSFWLKFTRTKELHL